MLVAVVESANGGLTVLTFGGTETILLEPFVVFPCWVILGGSIFISVVGPSILPYFLSAFDGSNKWNSY